MLLSIKQHILGVGATFAPHKSPATPLSRHIANLWCISYKPLIACTFTRRLRHQQTKERRISAGKTGKHQDDKACGRQQSLGNQHDGARKTHFDSKKYRFNTLIACIKSLFWGSDQGLYLFKFALAAYYVKSACNRPVCGVCEHKLVKNGKRRTKLGRILRFALQRKAQRNHLRCTCASNAQFSVLTTPPHNTANNTIRDKQLSPALYHNDTLLALITQHPTRI